jgi:hypothetical protein
MPQGRSSTEIRRLTSTAAPRPSRERSLVRARLQQAGASAVLSNLRSADWTPKGATGVGECGRREVGTK